MPGANVSTTSRPWRPGPASTRRMPSVGGVAVKGPDFSLHSPRTSASSSQSYASAPGSNEVWHVGQRGAHDVWQLPHDRRAWPRPSTHTGAVGFSVATLAGALANERHRAVGALHDVHEHLPGAGAAVLAGGGGRARRGRPGSSATPGRSARRAPSAAPPRARRDSPRTPPAAARSSSRGPRRRPSPRSRCGSRCSRGPAPGGCRASPARRRARRPARGTATARAARGPRPRRAARAPRASPRSSSRSVPTGCGSRSTGCCRCPATPRDARRALRRRRDVFALVARSAAAASGLYDEVARVAAAAPRVLPVRVREPAFSRPR